MEKSNKVISAHTLIGLYVLDGLMNLFLPYLFPSLSSSRYITKPLLMILLMVYAAQEADYSFRKSLLITLFFSLLGDVFLMLPGTNPLNFQLGILAFLCSQIGYILLFYKQRDSIMYLFLLPILIYVGGFLAFLLPHVSPMLQIPVVVYALALGAMLFFALNRKKDHSYNQVALGAVLFVSSDSILAILKFYSSFQGNSLAVMGTYIAAQLLLSLGLCKLQTRN
jgi:uncharacterized membrane protein YhhN